MFQCISITRLKPEKYDEVIAAARKLADMTREEEGNITYQVLQAVNETCTIILAEKWESEENFNAHVSGAGTEGDPVNAFGKLMDEAGAEPSILLPCKLIY